MSVKILISSFQMINVTLSDWVTFEITPKSNWKVLRGKQKHKKQCAGKVSAHHQKVLHGSVRIVEAGPQCCNHLLPLVAHGHDLSHHVLIGLTGHYKWQDQHFIREWNENHTHTHTQSIISTWISVVHWKEYFILNMTWFCGSNSKYIQWFHYEFDWKSWKVMKKM